MLAPLLPGAACRDEWQLFDATIVGARGGGSSNRVNLARIQALQVCESCPCLNDCRIWFDSLPPHHRPYGVVAGQLSTRTVPGQRHAG